MQALQKRENGLAYPGSDSFSPNQQRYFSNMYIPNHRSMRLMSLDAKVFVSKFNKTGTKLLTACQGQFQFQFGFSIELMRSLTLQMALSALTMAPRALIIC